MSIEAAFIFRDALLGLQFLHDNSWLHGDIKPQNIGVLPTKPPRAVILDFGQAALLEVGLLTARPGRGGTINYLAPERELTAYNHLVDIWSMAVIGFELIYGHHPFRFAINPWRPGREHINLRQTFNTKYQQALATLSSDYLNYVGNRPAKRDQSFLHGTISFP